MSIKRLTDLSRRWKTNVSVANAKVSMCVIRKTFSGISKLLSEIKKIYRYISPFSLYERKRSRQLYPSTRQSILRHRGVHFDVKQCGMCTCISWILLLSVIFFHSSTCCLNEYI
ncbi:uncharacterized protein LOC105285760 [Ooceraea biroi]|uniref:uncharacterized protein LOC105285760 n=1 Tax=Ooceraea biroi TaxID=2015173 RepID=UPI0005BC68B2|nr:uncharacterized protein LOC105285760 [Ooceraea biroi]